jgi:acetyl-CoA C-acetyltransferase
VTIEIVVDGAGTFLAKPLDVPGPTAAQGWLERYGDQEISQFRRAELIAQQWGISRREMEEFALESNRRAIEAAESALRPADYV